MTDKEKATQKALNKKFNDEIDRRPRAGEGPVYVLSAEMGPAPLSTRDQYLQTLWDGFHRYVLKQLKARREGLHTPSKTPKASKV